ncbi:hypothetical protein DNTS_002063 [Danionella cerebrum]|uniref:Ependymin n=1 Tax=Danionella cerebrum TaxID=2873325 RepID=A0A553MZ42_9TELE|nr:hypothetical protein DNTS_002063 [Danionella translucida]
MMKIFIVALICLCLAQSSYAQKPEPCKTFPLLEGALYATIPGQHLRVFEKFSYDALGQNVRLLASGSDGNQTFSIDRLLLYREGVSYEIHYHNKTCTKEAFKAEFRHIGVPHNANFMAQMVLGSSSIPSQGLLVNNWNGTWEETKVYTIDFTKEGEMGVMTSFFDLVEGIEDPNVFIPPPFCDSVKVMPARENVLSSSFFPFL